MTGLAAREIPPVAMLADCGIVKLEAEPQEGPTEYKLHLLLRPRRSFTTLSTVQHVSGSHQSKPRGLQLDMKAELKQPKLSPGPTPSSQSRQNRLQHLTTQLLWRLQQSSPYHSSSTSALVVPVLPQIEANRSLSGPEKLLPGLEGTQGALYEIGVSDDGTFVGLTEDELEESLTTLRAMAFSLGCKVKVLRMVLVGKCQWTEEIQQAVFPIGKAHTENLWVAEALVTPSHDSNKHAIIMESEDLGAARVLEAQRISQSPKIERVESQTEQLRVSLTGSTTSGKSSLLGTLSTSTLDNGRGKSRLSLLKHRHEIISGISSSVTPELIGYHDMRDGSQGIHSSVSVVNYASGNVSSWNDIHSASEPGRLVFCTDSAGHPRYFRTTVRGLVSWAPHWTICCVAANDEDVSTSKSGEILVSQETLSSNSVYLDDSRAHLILCLKLNLPLVVVVTKYDLTSKRGLRQTLAKILSMLKSSGRQPNIFPTNDPSYQELQLQRLGKSEEEVVQQDINRVKQNQIHLWVPIVLTSAVTGRGISQLHALLRHLPIPQLDDVRNCLDSRLETARHDLLFHIDDFFTMSDGHFGSRPGRAIHGIVLSGHLRYGTLMAGDEVLVGPSTANVTVSESQRSQLHRAKSFPGQGKESSQRLCITYDDRPCSGDFTARAPNREGSSTIPGWQKVRIMSIRNLRLPVRKLLAGQVGTVGITFGDRNATGPSAGLTPYLRIRKGMVLLKASDNVLGQQLPSYRGFIAVFDGNQSRLMVPGSLIIVYIASIRASARILSVTTHAETIPHDKILVLDCSHGNEDGAGFSASDSARGQDVAFQFVTGREWMEVGVQVLVMPAGGLSVGRTEGGEKGRLGLDGCVGRITQILQ